jgi:hypothetical protein
MVHANVALSLQDPGPRPTFWQQRGIDLLSLVVASFATAYFFWRPVFRRSGESAFWRKIVVIVSGLAISLALWLGVSLFVTYTRYHYGSQLGPWRFGLIMGLVSIFIAFMNDLSQPILEQTETTFGRAWDWLFRQARARTPEAASAATPESRSDTGSDHT